MAVTGCYIGLTAAELATMRADCIAALQAVRKAGQSNSRSAASTQRANLRDLQNDLAEINHAAGILSGDRVNRTYVDFSGSDCS